MAGPQCCSNPPILDPSSGVGHLQTLGGLKSYVTGSLDSKRAVVLISDIFGFEAPKLRKLADKVAAAGFYVVVPDFLYGDIFSFENKERPLPIWLKDHGTDKGFEDAKPVIEDVRSKLGVSAIGAAGFCWGAKLVLQLATSEFIQAGVILHPAFVVQDDFKDVKAPIAVLGAEFDELSPPELLNQFGEVLAAKSEIDSLVKVFPKVEHGWTTRYDEIDEAAVKSAEEAQANLLDWFLKYVK